MMNAAARQKKNAVINVILNVFSASMSASFSASGGRAGTGGCFGEPEGEWAMAILYLSVCT
jgi:hypothetical protein